ncbi:MAG: hypothetical protein H6732_19550 [Alphaproteobacteria bacterium]|nr:hypothetical protein [Alphaproteobacteria bacterium]
MPPALALALALTALGAPRAPVVAPPALSSPTSRTPVDLPADPELLAALSEGVRRVGPLVAAAPRLTIALEAAGTADLGRGAAHDGLERLDPRGLDAALRAPRALGAPGSCDSLSTSADGAWVTCRSETSDPATTAALTFPAATPWRDAATWAIPVAHPDGRHLARGDVGGAAVWDVDAARPVARLAWVGGCDGGAWSEDGAWLLLACVDEDGRGMPVAWRWSDGATRTWPGSRLRHGARTPVAQWLPAHRGWWVDRGPSWGLLVALDGEVTPLFEGTPSPRPPPHFDQVTLGWTSDGRGGLWSARRRSTGELWIQPFTLDADGRPRLDAASLLADRPRAFAARSPGGHVLVATGHPTPRLEALAEDGSRTWGPEPLTPSLHALLLHDLRTGRCPTQVSPPTEDTTHLQEAVRFGQIGLSPDGRWSAAHAVRPTAAAGPVWTWPSRGRIGFARPVPEGHAFVPLTMSTGERDPHHPGFLRTSLAFLDVASGAWAWARADHELLAFDGRHALVAPQGPSRSSHEELVSLDLAQGTATRWGDARFFPTSTGDAVWAWQPGQLLRLSPDGTVQARVAIPAHLGGLATPGSRWTGVPAGVRDDLAHEERKGWSVWVHEHGAVFVRTDDPDDALVVDGDRWLFGWFAEGRMCGPPDRPPASGFVEDGAAVVLGPQGAQRLRDAPPRDDEPRGDDTLVTWLADRHGLDGWRMDAPLAHTRVQAGHVVHQLEDGGWALIRPDGSGVGRDPRGQLTRVDPTTGAEDMPLLWRREPWTAPPPVEQGACPWHAGPEAPVPPGP